MECTAFLNSGADCTLVPYELLSEVGAKVTRAREMILGTSRGKTVVVPYFVSLSFDRFVCESIRVRGCASDDLGGIVLIGRDLINSFVLELNGIDLTFTIS